MKLGRFSFLFAASLAASFVFLSVAFADEPTSDATQVEWTPLFKGVDVARREIASPLQKIVAIRVDLQADGIKFKTTPPNPNFEPEKRETYRQTTPEFLEQNGLAVAVNGNYYTPFDRETILNPGDANITGLAISDGFVESQPRDGFPSFLVGKDGTVEIRQVATDENLDGIAQAVSGPAIVLKDGEIVEQNDPAIHPRTAVGYSQDKRFVYFVVIDGRRPDFSVGATLEEVGDRLRSFGAYDGLNLDGGGSTTMVVRGDDGRPEVLNRPINPIVPGPIQLRQNGNAIGVEALAL